MVPKPAGASPKTKPIRDEAYRRHVAGLPCRACGWQDSQAAHISVGNYARGMKAGDDLCIPLCPAGPNTAGCHTEFDQHQEWFAKYVLGLTIDELKAEARADFAEWRRIE